MGTIEIIGIAIGSIATLLGGVWFIVQKIFDVAKFSGKLDVHDKDISILQAEVKMLSIEMTRTTTMLTINRNDASITWGVKHSPRRLNESGTKIYNDANGQAFLDANKDYLFAEIDRRKPLAKLDVEDASYAVLIDATRLEAFNPIKTFIYNAPYYDVVKDGETRQLDVSLVDMCFVLSIPLRDMYLAEHPEITA